MRSGFNKHVQSRVLMNIAPNSTMFVALGEAIIVVEYRLETRECKVQFVVTVGFLIRVVGIR